MAIFNAISQLVISAEFNHDQSEFASKNISIFDEEEENKHEYKQVYEDYCNIMDRTIEAKLKEEHQFQEADIQKFMETFKDNLESYKAVNADTFDILYSFIEFDKFKQMMLDNKKSANVEASSISTAESSEHEKIQSAAGKDTASAWASYN